MSDHRRTARLAATLLSTTLLGAAAVVALPAQAVGTPTASFTMSTPTPQVNESVTFDASASSPSVPQPVGSIDSYAWDWNNDGTDDTVTSSASVLHSFPARGQVTVKLTVTDSTEATASTTKTFLVGDQAPTAVLSAPGSAYVDAAVQLDASGSTDPDAGDALSYAWDWDNDGSVDATTATTETSYHVAGTYTIKLTVTDPVGVSDTETRTISITNTAPSASFTVNPGSPKATQEVTFDASGSTDTESAKTALTYSWDFGDGTTATGNQAQAEVVTHTYATGGSRTVTLTITDPQGEEGTSSKSVSVGANGAPTVVLTADHDHVNPGQSVAFDGTGTTDAETPDNLTLSWDFGDGSPVVTGTKAQVGNVAHSFANSDQTYTVTLTATDAGGASTSGTVQVQVGHFAPTAAYTATPNPVSVDHEVTFDGTGSTDPEGEPLTYAWSYTVGGGQPQSLGTSATVQHTFHTAGTYAVSLKVTDADGLSNTRTTNLSVTNTAPTAEATATPSQPAQYAPVAFDGSGSSDVESAADTLTYEWDFDGDAQPDATGLAAQHTFDTAGPATVTLSVTDPQGAVGTKELNLLVQPNGAPTADAGTPTPNPAHAGAAVAFDGSGSSDPDTLIGDSVAAYSWDFGDGSPAATTSQANHAYAAAGVYDVTLTVADEHGATDTATVQVTVTNTAPTASISATPSAAGVGKAIAFKAGGTDAETPSDLTYAWTFGDGGTSTTKNPGHTYTKPGIFSVGLTVTDPQGLQASATRTVKIVKGVACQGTKVTRTGSWRVRSSSAARGGYYCDNLGTGSGADTLVLGFSGPQVGLTFARASKGGTAKVYVDGVLEGTVDFHSSSSSPTFGHRVVFGGLGAGSHKLRVVVSSGAAYVDDLLVWGPLT